MKQGKRDAKTNALEVLGFTLKEVVAAFLKAVLELNRKFFPNAIGRSNEHAKTVDKCVLGIFGPLGSKGGVSSRPNQPVVGAS